MKPIPDTTEAASAVDPLGVPGCGTGPVGRFSFVARELAALWRELAGHPRAFPAPKSSRKNTP